MNIIYKGLELLVIAFSLFAEGAVMTKGSDDPSSFNILKQKTKGNDTWAACLGVVALLYLIYTLTWCCSDIPPVKIAGIMLIMMTCLGVILKGLGVKSGMTYVQVDAGVSLLCLGMVLVCRIRGYY